MRPRGLLLQRIYIEVGSKWSTTEHLAHEDKDDTTVLMGTARRADKGDDNKLPWSRSSKDHPRVKYRHVCPQRDDAQHVCRAQYRKVRLRVHTDALFL